ncbi:hypothetical protein Hanom_Chr11g01016231 [Helianthus anomalus]
MPRNAYSTLQYANDDLWRNYVMINDNELVPYKIPKKPTNTNFIRVFFIFKFSFAKFSCFRTTENANVNNKHGNSNAPTVNDEKKAPDSNYVSILIYYDISSFVFKFYYS